MGISATVGGLATSVYYLYGNMTVADVLPEDKDLQDALGDMKDMSAEDFVGLMRRWLDAPDSFDISDLESKYGFSTVDLVNKLAGGSSDPDDEKNVIKQTEENQPYIDDLKSVSIFSLLSGKVAFKDFMADVPMGAVLAFIPSDKILDSAQRAKLRKYSLGQLISTDEVKNQPGIFTALSDLTFGGILPGVFEENGGVYTVKEGKPQALNLLANIQFGGIFDVVTGSSDIGTELVEGGLSPIGEMKVGDFLIDLGVSKEGDELPGKLNAIFDEMQIRDLFEKDVTTNKYKFVIDRLLDRVEIGSIMGYTKKENGAWVQKSDDGETEVNGLLGYLADLNLTDVYHAFADEGTVEQKIHNFLLVFGDLSVGDILETFKYTKDENGVWKKPDGEPVQSELLKSLMDFTIEDVVGDKDSELTGKQIRLNVVAAISKLAGDDLTVAKGLGELFKLKFDEDGNPVKDENGYYLDENGESVGVFKTRLFDIKFKDLAVAFGGDKIELDAIYGVFEESLGGVTLGNALGMTYSDGSWKNKDGGEITGIVSLLYDIRFGGVFSLLRELENSKEFSFSNVIRGFLPYASMGDIIAPLLGYSKVGEGNEVRYYDKNGEKIEDGLNTILLLKLWQIAAGFDKNAEYSLKEEIKDVRLGEILNGKCDYDSLGESEWTIFGRTARGNLAKFFDLTLEQLIMTKSEENTRMIGETVKNISLGSVLAFALKYEEGTGDEYGTILGKDEKINGVFDAFLTWDYVTYANITGGGFKNKELLREELNNQFGEFMLGETFVPFAAEKLGDGTYNFKTLEQASGLVNVLFNTSYETIFNFIFSEDKDIVNFIVEVLGDTTIGDVVAPVVGMKKVDDAYVLSKGEGKSLGVAISAILDTKIGSIITLLTDKNDNRTITQKLLGGKTNEEGLINLDFMLGQYVETFLGFKYDKADGKWYDKNEKEIYNPVSRLLSVNMFDLLDHLLGISQKYTADEKKDYLFGILDGIKIGDLLKPILDKVGKLNDKQLIKLISDIVLVDTKGDENKGLVCDLLDADKDKLDVINDYFGGIKLGYVAELFLYAKETDATNHVWTKNDNGETYPVMLGDIFSVSVGYILDIVKNRTGEPNLAVNIVNQVFPQRRVGDLIAIIVPNFADNCQKDGIDNIWGVNKNPLPLVLSDVFDVTFETVLNAVIGDQEAIDKVISITDKAFKYEEKEDGSNEGRTFNDYFKNFGLNDFNDGTLRTIGQTKVGEFIRGVLGKVVKDPFTGETYTTIEYLKMLVGGVAFRDVVGIAVKSVKDLSRPLILSDVIDRSFGDVFDLIDAITNKNLKGGIYKLLNKITHDDERTFGVYLDDILRGKNAESIIKKNRGIDGLTQIEIATLVGLILKVDGIRVDPNEGVEKFGVDSTTLDPIINYVLNLTDSVLIGDFLRNSDGSGYRLEDGKWYDDKGNACIDALNTVFSAPTSYVLYLVYGIMNPSLISDAVKELKVGTVLMPLYNMLISKAFAGSEMGLKDKDAEEANKEYEIKGAFSAFLTELSNKTIGGVMEDFKNNKPLEVIKDYVLDRPIGDYAYDLIRVLTKGKICKGYACDATDENGNYVISGNLADVLQAAFNIKVNVMLSSVKKGVSGVKQLAKDTYKDFTVGDFTYDVFRKYAATKVRLTAGGTARDYKSNNLVLTGKMAKVFRATFNMKITEAASIIKKIKVKNGVLDFVNTYYGKLSLGDVFGAVTEKLVAKKLKVTFNYDVANDYALTISGNFNEVFGAIFASELGGLIEAYKAKSTAKYFLDEETGIIGKLPLGDILAYVCKTKSLEKQMKYTEIEKGEDGKWNVEGAYETPLDIAFNDLTIGKVYKERANFQNNILKPYFGVVKVGELMGGRYDEANDEWIKPNGEVVKNEGAHGIIMTKIYMLTIEEVTNKDFKITSILDDIYAGEILGYYYCGHYKFTTDENETRYNFCEPENSHKDYEYHVHDDGETYSKKSEFVTALSGIKLCADVTHTDENHKWHYHDEIDCTFKSHTDTTHTLGGWYKDEGGTEKVSAIENAFANIRLGYLMGGSFEFSDIVRGVKFGDAMNMVRCGGSDETCDIPDATHEHKAGAWYKLNESTNTYEASGVLLDRIADKDLGDIFDNGLNLGETFDGVLLGDVMGYKYCNGESDCTYKDVDSTHTHIASGSEKVWYVLDDKGTPDASDDVYNRATTLEAIVANVSMSSVIDGGFSIETQIKDVKIGELMSYEYCDGTNECLPHGSGTHAEGWYRNDSGTWTKITDNLILCVADFTITDIRKDDFGTRLSNKVKENVTVGDIFEGAQTGPLSLIPSTTKVGDISTAIEDAIDNSTAIDLFNAGVLPIKSDNGANTTAPGGTLEKLDSTFDKIRPYVIAGGVDTDGSGTVGDSALDIVITFTAEEKAKATAAATVSAEDKVTYQIADGYQYDNGRKFWGSLKLEEMVDVLLSVVTATV